MKKLISSLLCIFVLTIAILIPNIQTEGANKNTLVFHTEYISDYSEDSYKKTKNYLINKFTQDDSYNDEYCVYRDDTKKFIKKYKVNSTDKKILTYNYYSFHAMMVGNLVMDVRDDYEAHKINKDTYLKSMKLLNSYFKYNIESGKQNTLKTCPKKGYNEFETMLYYGRNYTNFCLKNTDPNTDLLFYLNKRMKSSFDVMEEDVEGIFYIKDIIECKYIK